MLNIYRYLFKHSAKIVLVYAQEYFQKDFSRAFVIAVVYITINELLKTTF